VSEHVPVYNDPSVVVQLGDDVLTCRPYAVGGYYSPRELRWVAVTADGTRHMAPRYVPGVSQAADTAAIAEWWSGRADRTKKSYARSEQ
jgi:hypothetical protein